MSDFRTVDYTDKDFEALQERLHALVLTVFPDWLQKDVVAFGNFMLDAYAFVGDVLNTYNDSNLREAFSPTAQLLQSMLLFAEGIGTRIPLQSPATDDVLFTPTGIRGVSVTIPAYTIVTTKGEDPVPFQTLLDVVMPAGAENITIGVEQSEKVFQEITPAGTAWWTKWLDRSPFLDIISAIDEDGSYWTEVDSLVESGPTDKHFEVRVNANGLALMRFGDGILGMIPTKDIVVTHKIGGGIKGNVAAGTIKEIQGAFLDAEGQSINFTVNNPDEASGGLDRMSVDAARRFIPASRRTRENTIDNKDFVDNALEVPGVARALMLTSDEETGIPENMGHLIIVPHGGGLPSSILKDTVHNKVTIEKPSTITFKVDMYDPHFKTVDTIARVYLEPGSDPDEAKDSINADIDSLFEITRADGTQNPNVDFGGSRKDASGYVDSTFPFSFVYNTIFDNSYVRKLGDVLLNGISGDVILQTREFPVKGTVTLINGDTGATL